MPEPVLSAIHLGGDPVHWRDCGFAFGPGGGPVGGVDVVIAGGPPGIASCALTGVGAGDIDGLPTVVPGAHAGDGARSHPNGAVGIDHVVALTPSLERTITALEAQAIRLRRVREGETGMGPRRQAFFRVGQPILEVVETAELGPEEPARFWGITFAVADLQSAAELLGDRLGAPRDAVQPGRRIATVRRDAGLGVPVALITRRSAAPEQPS